MHAVSELPPLDALLASFREAAHDNRDLGDLFERMIANYPPVSG